MTHLARAISVRDLRDQVKARLPPEVHIPSIEWIRLQFWRKLRRLGQHYSTPVDSRYVSWCSRDDFAALTLMLNMQQLHVFSNT